jgi:hypothetical protein
MINYSIFELIYLQGINFIKKKKDNYGKALYKSF